MASAPSQPVRRAPSTQPRSSKSATPQVSSRQAGYRPVIGGADDHDLVRAAKARTPKVSPLCPLFAVAPRRGGGCPAANLDVFGLSTGATLQGLHPWKCTKLTHAVSVCPLIFLTRGRLDRRERGGKSANE